PLHMAVSRSIHMVEALLNHRHIDVNSRDATKLTPLVNAAEDGADIAILQMLVAKGALVDAVNNTGHTALMVAAHKSVHNVVVFLLAEGASVNMKTADGTTALHMATDVHVTKTLLAAGADSCARDNRLSTPLHAACTKGLEHVCVLLLHAGAEVFAED
ncbi:ankyrin repeat-containing domain protein, partial [Baffinella frigidus]